MVSITGNARACVFLEPLFTVPNTMYAGFMTLYMLELGISKEQVGMITSLGLASGFFFALIGPFVTDKIGRRKSTLIFDAVSWVIAQSIWALARNIYFFVVAAVINASVQIVSNSLFCLMLEDSRPESRVHIFNLLQITGILAGFFAPLGALLISRFTIIPAVRLMLVFGVVLISAQIIIRHLMVSETSVGKRKMREMKSFGIREIIKIYLPVILKFFWLGLIPAA